MRRLILSVVVLLIGVTASAQRTIPGQMFIQAGFQPAHLNQFSVGAGQYSTVGFWYADATFATDRLDPKDITLGVNGGYLWRLAANTRRSINLYGGVTGSVSYHNVNPHDVPLLEAVIEEGEPSTYFYDKRDIRTSIQPTLILEFFPFKAVSLFISGYVPCQFSVPITATNNQTGKKNPYFNIFVEGSVGVRFLL